MSRVALIAGQGALPAHLAAGLAARGQPFLLAEMEGFPADLPGVTPLRFRLERLVPFLDHLADQGVTEIVLAGAVRRPRLEPELFDARTATLVPRFLTALQSGDDAALRLVIGIFEEWGFTVRGAHEIAPDLLPPAGVATAAAPAPGDQAAAALGEAAVAAMGRADLGQACVVSADRVVAREDATGTDAMLGALPADPGQRRLLFKAPKPGQDRRADLPVIGPGTAARAAAAGLAGIVIEAGGVMLLDPAPTLQALDAAGLFLWVRPPGGQR